MGQFSMTISTVAGSVLGDNQHRRPQTTPDQRSATMELRQIGGIGAPVTFWSQRCPHKALGGRPPAVVYSLQIEATQPDQQARIRA